jgi:hypothetical protein
MNGHMLNLNLLFGECFFRWHRPILSDSCGYRVELNDWELLPLNLLEVDTLIVNLLDVASLLAFAQILVFPLLRFFVFSDDVFVMWFQQRILELVHELFRGHIRLFQIDKELMDIREPLIQSCLLLGHILNSLLLSTNFIVKLEADRSLTLNQASFGPLMLIRKTGFITSIHYW